MDKRSIGLCCGLLALLGCLALPVSAVECSCEEVYCFSAETFSQEEDLTGIWILDIDQESAGKLMLGSRQIFPGDALTREQLKELTFHPVSQNDTTTVSIEYLPVLSSGTAPCAQLSLSIFGKENKAPAAEDFALETYKNLELTGALKVTDPEQDAMTFAVTRQPKRGTLELRPDGSFTYTPKKNKVGIDSFRYTATDEGGHVSREATVTISILKPSPAPAYTDTTGRDCAFAAEWMKHTGIFVGEQLDGRSCFRPDETVSRGEFYVMLTRTLELEPLEEVSVEGWEDAPQWLQPYLAAALRAGIAAGLDPMNVEEPIPAAEADAMIAGILDLPTAADAQSGCVVADPDRVTDTAPAWSEEDQIPLTRGEAAMLLYDLSRQLEDTRFISLE